MDKLFDAHDMSVCIKNLPQPRLFADDDIINFFLKADSSSATILVKEYIHLYLMYSMFASTSELKCGRSSNWQYNLNKTWEPLWGTLKRSNGKFKIHGMINKMYDHDIKIQSSDDQCPIEAMSKLVYASIAFCNNNVST